MARPRTPRRLHDILDAARQVFLVAGYRRARMTDVARVAAVSPGLLYSYAAGKEALFYLVLQRELGVDIDAAPTPVPNPEPEAIDALIGRALRDVSNIPALTAAMHRDAPSEPAAELAAIVGEHYDRIHRYRYLIQLVERSALDWPELAERFYDRGRRPFVRRLGRYLARGADAGQLVALANPDVGARYVIEVIAWFANHRYGDRDGAIIDDDIARTIVIELVTRGFLAR